MLTGALPRSPAALRVRWAPSVPALLELMLVGAAIAVLWPSFDRVAQLGGAGRDQRFLDRGIAVAGLPDAVLPAACESVGALAEAHVGAALCGSRRAASARASSAMPSALAHAIARASEAFQRPLRDAEERALALRVQAESGAAELRDQADAIAAIESAIAPFRQRFQISGGDDAGPLPLRCAARWLDAALAARPTAEGDAAGGATGRANGVLLLAAALDGRVATAPLAAEALLPSAPLRAPACRGASESLAATAALMADARQSLANSRKNEAMRDLVPSAGLQWAAAMALGYAFLLWSRRGASPALGTAAALAAWAAAAWLARVPWPLAGARELAFGRAEAAWASMPGVFVLGLVAAAAALALAALARRAAHARPAPVLQSMSSRIGYPGLVLATGLGWLILLDLSLAGHAGNRYLALYHQGHLWLAMLALSVLLFARRPVSRGFAWLLSLGGETIARASRRHGAFSVAALIVLATAAAVLGFGLALAHLRQLTSELGRVWLIVGAAWFFFLRAGPLTERLARGGTAATSFLRYAWPMLFVVAVLVGAMFVTRDMGPLLIAGYASGAALAAALAMWWHHRSGQAISAFALALLLFAAWIGAVTFALFRVGAHDSVTASRLESVAAPFVSINDQLALVSWFQRAAPAEGFGIGAAPWCGFAASRGCSGVPAQIHSDYTFTAMVGIFGPFVAWAVSVAMAIWLHRLIRHHGRVTRGEPRLLGAGGQLGHDGQALLSWIAVAWVVLTSCQLAVTVAGNLAVLPLTGVTFPFVSFGMTSLLVNMAFLALCLNVDLPPAPNEARRSAMAERDAVSLLDCAIAASLAVVPVLLGVVALVALVRPGDPDSLWHQGHSDRYVSVRHVAALQTFERAIVRRSTQEPRLVTASGVLEAFAPCRREWSGETGARQWLRRVGLAGADDAPPAAQIAAQLGELDAALLRFSARPNGRAEHRVGVDPARWFAAAADALATPLETADAPGQRFQLRCADLAGALAALRRGDAAMLETFAWRGSEGAATLARWRPEQEMRITAREVTRKNPWGGIAGCIYLGRADGSDSPGYFLAGAGSAQQRVCATPEVVRVAAAASGAGPLPARAPTALRGEPGVADAVDDPRWMVPPSLFTLLQPLETLRQPSGPLYRIYAESESAGDVLARAAGGGAPVSRNRVVLDGAPVDVGYSIDITIDPSLQALAQKTAACYTGRHDVCRALAMRRAEDRDQPLGAQLLEGAMVRMAAVAVIDIASGRIEALAGALSPCARQEVDGPGRDAGCDTRLPYPVQYRGDALLNPAVYHDAMPASTIKPIMATAFLADPGGRRLLASERAAMQKDGTPARDSLRGQLMRSDSARFLDRMFCIDQGFASCARPWDVQAAARAFGWNAGCADGDESCGKADLLFGGPLGRSDDRGALAPGPTAIAYGRVLSEPAGRKLGAPMRLMAPTSLDAGILRRCAAGPDGRRLSDDDWEKCKGGAVVDVVAEGWGQGHARASVVGVAGMMATLAAAANGAAGVPRPHLVAALHGVASSSPDGVAAASARWGAAPAPSPLPRDAAEVILSGLSYSHRAGTARTACEQVFDARRCRDIDWLAGKTGTPSFPSDGLSLDALVRLCRDGAPPSREAKRGACSSLHPYKWYVAAWRGDRDKDGPWTKAIAVLAERNWVRASGRVHGAGDHGPNPAAEIALQIVGRTTGAIDDPVGANRSAVARANTAAPAAEATR